MMNAPVGLPRELAVGKIQEWHRGRLAVVYVRQSTMAQVIEHGESTRLQYGLSGRAADLGWEPSRVLVIDEDPGRSASGAEARPGFQRLVSEVGLDHRPCPETPDYLRNAGPCLLGWRARRADPGQVA